ncbi:hypothetical protein A3B48_01310 [Candidatus Gottesmanbacteria bacterium RIFCSPLOWO2_01_FULL_40_10]|nr:MAG: hypothetical protein A3B48_01310 [Candidatus Gottesmanbacteria bacterium RIFCSPLOWO2_01_FULL_40_10]
MKKNRILSGADIDYLEKRFEEKFPTKDEFNKFKDNIFTKLDKILKEVTNSREEQIIIAHRISDHGEKLEILEKAHSQGKHSI